MKRKDFILFGVSFLLTMAGIAIWHYTQAPKYTAQDTLSHISITKTDAIRLAMEIPQVELPSVPPVPLKPETAESKPAPNPFAKPDTTITEAIRLAESNDWVTYLNEITRPEFLKNLSPNEIENMARDYQAHPELTQNIQDGWLSIQGLTPTLSNDGNLAIYNTVFHGSKWQIILKKEDGLWYMYASAPEDGTSI